MTSATPHQSPTGAASRHTSDGWNRPAVAGRILTPGGFIFYNTNVPNEYHTASDRMETLEFEQSQPKRQRHAYAFDNHFGLVKNVKTFS